MKKIISGIILVLITMFLSGCDLVGTPANEAPVVEGENYLIFEIFSEEPDWTTYVTALDTEDGVIRITATMVEASEVDMNYEGTYVVTYYISDSGGTTTSYTIEVQIIDLRVPTMTLIGEESVVIEVHDEYTELGVIAVDEESNTLEYEVIGIVDTETLGENIIEYKIVGRDFSIYRLVTVVDTVGPTIILEVAEFMYVSLGTEFTDPGITIEDNYYSEGFDISIKGAVDTTTEGIYEIEYSATDLSNNIGETVIRTVTVIDGELPLFAMNGEAEMTIQYEESYTELGALIIIETGMFLTEIGGDVVNSNIVGDYTVVYTYVDIYDVAHTSERIVHVVDTVAPEIVLLGEAVVVIEYGETYLEWYAVANENYDDNLEVLVDNSELDLTTVGTYYIYYNLTDSSGNIALEVTREVQVVDTVSPTASLVNGDHVYVTLNGIYTESGLEIEDNYYTADFIVDIVGTVDTTTEGDYVLEYIVTDPSGNIAETLTRTVTVIDATLPLAILIGEADVTLEYEDTYEELGADAVFEYGVFDMEITGFVDTEVLGDYTITYTYTDIDDVVFTIDRIIHVLDTTVPVIVLLGESVVVLEYGEIYLEWYAVAIENYDDDLEVLLDNSELDLTTIGTYYIYYDVTDSNGNIAIQVTREIQVEDTTSPTISFVGTDHHYVTLDGTWTEPGLDIEDNYYTEGFIIDIDQEVDTTILGDYVLIYTVTDPSGNVSETLTRTVSVISQAIPFIDSLEVEEMTVEYADTYIGENVTVTLSYGIFDMGISGTVDTSVLGDYILTFTYTDVDGFTHTYIRTVHVVDTTIPVINIYGPSVEEILLGEEVAGMGAEASDNYDIDLLVTEDLSELDINTIGTYYVYYDVTDSNGNVAVQVVREVHVIYHTPIFTVNSAETTNKIMTLDIDLEDIDSTIVNPVLTIKQGEIVIETITLSEGNNLLEITGLIESTDYSVEITGSYNLEDGNGLQDVIFYSEIISTRATLEPSWSLIGEMRTVNSLEINIEFTDEDLVMEDSYLVLIRDEQEIERILVDTGVSIYTYSELSSATDYIVVLEIAYDLGDGYEEVNLNVGIKSSIFTLPEGPPIIAFEAQIIDGYVGEDIPFVLELENPNNLEVHSITLNGVEITEFNNTSTNSLLVFDIASGDTAGTLTYTISEIKVYDDGVYTYIVAENNSVDIKVFRDVEVLSISLTNGEAAVEEYTNKMFTITIDNPEGYIIESITFGGIEYEGGTVYHKTDFVSVSATSVILSIPMNSAETNGKVRQYKVAEVTYSDGETTKTVSGTLGVIGVYIYQTLDINYINSVEDLQSIGQYGHYVLNTNLDLVGIQWASLSDFYGYFDGNGYVISNLTIQETTNSVGERYFGLFEINYGFITNLGLEDVNINISALNTEETYFYFVGGISGKSVGIITRSYIVGKIEVNGVPGSCVGGITGISDGNLEEVYTKGEIIVNTIFGAYVGGITGLAYGDIINAYSTVDIYEQSDGDSTVGGIVGYTGSNILKNLYYDGEILFTIGEGDYGGIAGTSYSLLENSYTTAYYLVSNFYESGAINSYLVGTNTNVTGYSTSYESNIDITWVDSMVGFDIETELGWDSTVWDFSTENPTLINLDNTPVYTAP